MHRTGLVTCVCVSFQLSLRGLRGHGCDERRFWASLDSQGESPCLKPDCTLRENTETKREAGCDSRSPVARRVVSDFLAESDSHRMGKAALSAPFTAISMLLTHTSYNHQTFTQR